MVITWCLWYGFKIKYYLYIEPNVQPPLPVKSSGCGSGSIGGIIIISSSSSSNSSRGHSRSSSSSSSSSGSSSSSSSSSSGSSSSSSSSSSSGTKEVIQYSVLLQSSSYVTVSWPVWPIFHGSWRPIIITLKNFCTALQLSYRRPFFLVFSSPSDYNPRSLTQIALLTFRTGEY